MWGILHLYTFLSHKTLSLSFFRKFVRIFNNNMNNEYRPSRFQILPPVIKNLLIINSIMFLATYVLSSTFGIDLEKKLGLYTVISPDFHPYQLVTHLFMHGSVAHIFSNMFALWMFGNVLENFWGGKRFLAYYIVTGLGAAFIHSLIMYFNAHALQVAVNEYLLNPTVDNFDLFVKNHVPSEWQANFQPLISAWSANPLSSVYPQEARIAADTLMQAKLSIPTVGASGAVFGILLAFGMLFPNTLIYIYFLIPIKAKYFVILYGLFELYSGFQNSPGDNVAHYAHLGGMLFGFILIKYWSKTDRNHYQ